MLEVKCCMTIKSNKITIIYTPNQTGCSVSGDTLQYRLEESISHRRTRQVTQLFTYLLTQRRTACHAHIGLFTFAL